MRTLKWLLLTILLAVFLPLGYFKLYANNSVTPAADGDRKSAVRSDTAVIQTEAVHYAPLQKSLTLTGQVAATETGRADVTTPLNGVVIEPLVKVGQRVVRGMEIAAINNVFGQTSLQLQQKLELDQAAMVAAQNSLQQAIATLGQAQSTLAQAETTASQAEDNLTQADAELRNARIDYARKNRLFEGGVSAKSDVEDSHERLIKAGAVAKDTAQVLKIAQRGVRIARENLVPARENTRLGQVSVRLAQAQVEHDRTIAQGAFNPQAAANNTRFYVRAPIGGMVVAVNMSAGQAVSPGQIVATVVDTTMVYVDGNAYESDLRGVHTDDPISVHCSSFPDKTFDGKVSYVGQQIDATTRTTPVRCLIRNQDYALRPGLFVEAVIHPRRPRQALAVSQEAVLIEGDDRYVVVDKGGGQYEKRKIKEGARSNHQVEILSGLKAGEKVVTRGNLLVIQ